MKLRAVFLLIIVNLTLAMVSPGRKANKHYECKFSDIPITVGDVQTMALPFAPVKDQYEATDVLNTMTSQTQPGNAPQMVNISSIYNIRTQYCFPIGQKPSTTLQILTHGIGFNGTFWDFHPSSTPSDERYSYISAFTAAAYSTLSYNRLGISGSTLADPDKEVQTTVALAVLASVSFSINSQILRRSSMSVTVTHQSFRMLWLPHSQLCPMASS